jgi:drug/metabolite transporter (DMT)-like permease
MNIMLAAGGVMISPAPQGQSPPMARNRVDLPLPEATAVSFVTPTFATVMAILFLREAVARRRWTALLVGLAGILILLRPGGALFSPAALFPLGSAFFGATAIILTRRIGGEDAPAATLLCSALVGFVLLSATAPLWFAPMAPVALAAE